VISSSSEPAQTGVQPLDVALLKSWDFAAWRQLYGHGSDLPYRIDHLERHGLRVHWTDSVHSPRWERSRAGAAIRRVEVAAVPFAQTLLMTGSISRSPVTFAMFESEANFLAMSRRARLRSPRTAFVVMTCWLAHILTTCSSRRLSGYRWAYQSVDRLYYLSANQGPILEERLALPPDRLRYLPFGVDTEGFCPTDETDGDYVLVVGRDKGRDWPTLIEALDGLDMPVKLCCRPADVAGFRIPQNVDLLGYVDRDVYRRLLSRARVVAIASRPVVYPSGQSVMLEAMAMARTVVVTKTPALEGYIEDGLNSLAVPAGDPTAMREAIRAAAEDDALRRRIGTQARHSAVELFGAAAMWGAVAGDLIQLAESRGFVRAANAGTP
jgi:glycosyltransferase involved in cell wall biosynthesis